MAITQQQTTITVNGETTDITTHQAVQQIKREALDGKRSPMGKCQLCNVKLDRKAARKGLVSPWFCLDHDDSAEWLLGFLNSFPAVAAPYIKAMRDDLL